MPSSLSISNTCLRVALAAFRVVVLLATGAVNAQSKQGGVDYLYSFQGQPDAAGPKAGLIQDAEGNLYGTSYYGGTGRCSDEYAYGCGTVFRVDPSGKETILYSFAGYPTDGQYPRARLLRDSVGNLYGTTSSGGSSYLGTVFELDATGKETVLYNFCEAGYPSCTDGDTPLGGLIQDAAGNLYGTTVGGGNLNYCRGAGCGTVFKLDPTGTENVLYSFTDASDGSGPEAELMMDAAGKLYGTTAYGGRRGGQCSTAGCGTVFKVDPGGTETILHSFAGAPDGRIPTGGLIQDLAGNLYGTTTSGGSRSEQCKNGDTYGCGTVFKINGAGKETVLHSFRGKSAGDGSYPTGSLNRDKAGNLYGTTTNGGHGRTVGTLFRLTPRRNETVWAPNHYPNSTLSMDSRGNLYGTTFIGGDSQCSDNGGYYSGCGEVFRLSP